MGIEGVITWYQKKIGTYDRQLWEKTIEQRILRGLANIQFRNAMRKKSLGTTEYDDNYSDSQMKPVNLKTEFIDIDLVRGSSFTKAKPKHGFITVAKLATLRFFLLPLYSKWWVQQTSGKVFILLLSLYLLQLFNVSIYSYNINKLPEDSTEYVPCTEVVVPIIMMWVLSLIHSQIVSTQSDPAHSHSQRHFKRTYKRRRKPKTHPLTKLAAECNAQKNETNESVKTNKGLVSKPLIKIQKDTSECSTSENSLRLNKPEHPLDDDGFESFNGNGSTPTDDTTEEYEVARSSGSFTCSQHGTMTGGTESNDFESDISQERHVHKIENLTDKDEKWNGHINKRVKYGQSAFWSVSGDSLQNGGIKKNDANWGLERQHVKVLTDSTSCDSEEDETILSSNIMESGMPLLLDGAATTTEWMGGTTNTEDCSYSSEPEPSDTENILWDTAFAPTAILSPSCALSDKVNCTVWKKNEIRKVELSVFDISCEIIARVEEMAESMDYFYIGMFYAVILALLPAFCRLSNSAMDSATSNELQLSVVEISGLVLEKLSGSLIAILDASLGITLWERTVMIVASLQRFILASLFFFSSQCCRTHL
ncbi:hypothetical protein ILUMI_20684 [Ignelater luminosus]|uniref:PHTF1/2 N-terminal domain-containing protein n=1 Tax=Ignelater luminosus TaxID=2038154 RepID=A0A8K0CDX9_IGNLU|nr:hypothetical protein ILUMI_20684 [Ignelater luminosus]